MARKSKNTEVDVESAGDLLTKDMEIVETEIWIEGSTPLIVHAWSQKAKHEMLAKQTGATKGGRSKREPRNEFLDAQYRFMSNGVETHGFPAMAIKNAMIAVAHKDRGITKTSVMDGIYIPAFLVRVQTTFPGSMCDMPILPLLAPDPVMREDSVKIGAGVTKTASLAYRPQYTVWAMRIPMIITPAIIQPKSALFLLDLAGKINGLGEWRNQRKGVFGAFKLIDKAKIDEWKAYEAGTGPLPVTDTTPLLNATPLAATGEELGDDA